MSELVEPKPQPQLAAPTSPAMDPEQPWRQRLTEAFAQLPPAAALPADAPPTLRFGGLLQRWIRREFAGLGVEGLADSEAHALRVAVDDYARRKLELWLTKLTVFEVNLAREQGRLCGETGQARLRSFFRLMEDDASALEIYQRYPVLIGRILRHFELLHAFLQQLAHRLVEDRTLLQARFGVRGALQAAELGRGDAHLGARQVVVLRFAEGRLLFKPRPLDVDALYAELARCIQPALEFPLRTPAVLLREDCGWQEFVEARGTRAEDAPSGESALQAARCFYLSMGAHLALMHFANVSDVHFDNMLVTAAGEPVFFDLETAFANSYAADHEVVRGVHHEALRAQLAQIARGVLKCGVLPSDAKSSAGMNALTDIDARETLSTVDVLVDQDSDRVRVARQPSTIEVRSWLPWIEGRRSRPVEHLEAIQRGFEQAYRALLADLPGLAARVRAAGDLTVRSVLRNTSMYGMFLMESTHPVYAASSARLHGLFSRLAIATEFQPAFSGVLADEIAQLMQFDVPAFRARLDSAQVRGWLPGDAPFYGRSPLQAFEANRAMLSAQDCARQQAWIRRSLGRSGFPAVAAGEGAAMEFVRAAAHWLLQRAECSDVDGSISWLQITLPEESGEVLPLPPTLYGGLAGMLLVFSAFARELACSACEDARLRLRRMLRADVERLLAAGEDSSLFQGCAGPLYALLQDARLHADPEQLAWVRERACDLGKAPLAAGAHDVIAGRAGVMLLLCDLLDAGDDARLGAQLTALGEALMAARRSERCSWPSDQGEELGGFSHGNSGIAHALIRAGERLRRADFIAVGVEALAFEDGRFAEAECNWPDLRRQTGAVFNVSWCNGSVGYLLTRAAHHGRLPSSAHERFDAALQALLQQTDFGDDSLCHGSAGVLDALVELHRMRPTQVSAQQIRAQLQRLLSAQPPRAGSRDCDAPGLMTGLAGMAYAVLRSLRPHLPCVLTVLR